MVRFKNRYLLVSLIFPNSPPNPFGGEDEPEPLPPPTLSEAGIISLLRESLSVNFGDIGAGEVGGSFSSSSLLSIPIFICLTYGFAVKYLSPATNILIVRVAREHLKTLWAALTLLRRIGGHEVLTRVMHVSGTIRKIQHAAMAHDRTAILANANRPKRTTPSTSDTEALLAKSEEDIMAIEQ